MKERNAYLRLYPDGKAVKWDDSPHTVTVWATFDQTTITFHDWDGNLIRRRPTLVVQSETGEDVYYRLPHDVEPPKNPNQTMQAKHWLAYCLALLYETPLLQVTLVNSFAPTQSPLPWRHCRLHRGVPSRGVLASGG